MAERTLTICDVDDREGSVVGSDMHIHITIGSKDYDADLCRRHADDLFEVVESFLSRTSSARVGRKRPGRKATSPAKRAARKSASTAKSTGRATKRAGRPRKSSGVSPDTVRSWARENGIAVSDRGRLSKTVLEQYAVATSTS